MAARRGGDAAGSSEKNIEARAEILSKHEILVT